MPTGKIKKIVLEKGYGFIRPDEGGGDVFFHHSATGETKIEDLGVGDAVQYDVQQGPDGKGPRAINVVRT
ncbi:MAG: cold shock domain-containing protein [Pirellulales bacterium]|nr:cold shock domain-containing protein [Pirellulales bacterium]